MVVDSYQFGRIVIDGKAYNRDVIILQDRVLNWWRKQGHLLQLEDLGEALAGKPDVFVIGSGYSGEMKVPEGLIQEIRAQGIEVVVDRTTEAVRRYNELSKSKKVVAALHITC